MIRILQNLSFADFTLPVAHFVVSTLHLAYAFQNRSFIVYIAYRFTLLNPSNAVLAACTVQNSTVAVFTLYVAHAL